MQVPTNAGRQNVNMSVLPVRTMGFARKADQLTTPRQISLDGDVLGDTLFDGTEDVVIGTAVVSLTTMEIDELMTQSMAIGG